MSQLTESWRALGIYAGFHFAGKGTVYIRFWPATGGRLACWRVHRPYYKTDRDAHLIDHGNKAFAVLNRHEKAKALDEAKAWASARYGITEWARTPYGSWMDAGFVKRRTAELKALAKGKL